MSVSIWISILLGGLALFLGFKYYRASLDGAALLTRFEPLISANASADKLKADAKVEADKILQEANAKAEATRRETANLNSRAMSEIAESQAAIDKLRNEWTSELANLQSQKRDLSIEYAQARTTYKKLRGEIDLLEENLDAISFGVYKPHFTYETSEKYKARLEELWESDKEMIKRGLAATANGTWEVGGSRAAGERMTKQYIKLLIRSFNAECDAAIAKLSWNNLQTMAARINKSFDSLNQLGTVMRMEITKEYRNLKLEELNLTHEMEEKKHEEREEARRTREQMREEEKVQRELATAEAEAAKEAQDAEKALAKAKKEAERLNDEGRVLMANRIQELEAQLASAQEKKDRVKAQAELTKCGHVYVLSNAGSFGEEIVKIGMTRRLEPRERVAELGDASVPFPFDLHALIYTDNAPALETELHDQFWEYRVNLANSRKEFFRVSLLDVETYIAQRGLKCAFNRNAEAKEFRQTCSDREREKAASHPPESKADQFPDTLFGDSVGQSQPTTDSA